MGMIRQEENRLALYEAATLLQDLNDEVVYVGGRIVGLLVTDELEDDVRPTFDIDVAVEVTGVIAHYALEDRLRALGFNPEGSINCRYVHGETIIDVMHTDGSLQGLNTTWYQDGFDHAIDVKIKDDKAIKILNSVYFLASKFEAFYDRSYKQKNYLDCKDLEDIVNVINGRPELVGEIQNAKEDVKKYISNFIALLINDAKWFDAIKSIARQERSRMIVLNALDKISKLSENE
jgi:hypothetical protein|tara:strand:- start:213 stop:914 length:702 start_codon:yes stop_codon:yes gene_type:complete